jgi:hypothetical protein
MGDSLMRLGSAACLFLNLVLSGTAFGADSIRGQVFIVTQGGENVRLGLVTVALYPEKEMLAYIARRSEEARLEREAIAPALDAAMESLSTANAQYENALKMVGMRDGGSSLNQRYDEVQRLQRVIWEGESRLRGLDSADFYFMMLPKPLRTSVTDAEGAFSIVIPKTGKYALTARGERNVSGTVETYSWLVRMPEEARTGTKVLLSNSTLTYAGSPLSLVLTRE